MRKNRVLLLGGGCVLLALLLALAGAYCAGFRFQPDIQEKLLSDMMQSKGYKNALALLTEHPALDKQLGAPLEKGKILNLEAWENEGNGAIRLVQEVNGPRNSGILHVNGTKSGGRWQYQECKVVFPDRKEWNLLKEGE